MDGFGVDGLSWAWVGVGVLAGAGEGEGVGVGRANGASWCRWQSAVGSFGGLVA